jgi:hypothetical protein
VSAINPLLSFSEQPNPHFVPIGVLKCAWMGVCVCVRERESERERERALSERHKTQVTLVII